MHSWVFSYFCGHSTGYHLCRHTLFYLAIKYQGSPRISPSTSFLLTLWFLHTLDSNLHQYTDESRSYISRPDLYSNLHTYITNCSLGHHLCIYISLTPQLNMPQSELSPNCPSFSIPQVNDIIIHYTVQVKTLSLCLLHFLFICYSQLIILSYGSYLLNISRFHLFLPHYHLSLCQSHHQSPHLDYDSLPTRFCLHSWCSSNLFHNTIRMIF